MLHKSIGITAIVPMRHIAFADAVLRESEVGLGDVSGVLAHQRKNTKNLGGEK